MDLIHTAPSLGRQAHTGIAPLRRFIAGNRERARQALLRVGLAIAFATASLTQAASATYRAPETAIVYEV